MKKWKNFLLIAFSIFAIATVNANQNGCCKVCPPPCPPPPPCECPPCPPCCEVPCGPTQSAYNHPASIAVCGCWDAFVTGTFLWVLPSMEQLEFAQTFFNSGSTGVGKIHEFEFDWKPAFKVGVGFNFDHDNWDVYLQYTRVNAEMHRHIELSDDPGAILLNLMLNQLADVHLSSTKEFWKSDFNMFDLEFGRPYYNGRCLIFRAHYGLKGGWFDNFIKDEGITTASPTIYTGTFNSKSWLIGPRAGIQTKWTFADGFRFFGDAAASLFYQKFFELNIREPFVPNPTLWFFANNAISKEINAAFEAMLGVGYGTYFDRNRWYFDLEIGYEVQLFLNQNKIIAIKDLATSHPSNIHTKAGNYMFHGLNVTVKFDF